MPPRALLVDAGHGLTPNGGIDNGAAVAGASERELVVQLARSLVAACSDLPLEIIPVGITERLSVAQKVKRINAFCKSKSWTRQDAILLSLHMNSGPASVRGVEAWYADGKPEAKTLARSLAEAVANGTGVPLRPNAVNRSSQNRLGRLGILDDTIPLSCLLEVGFVTNAKDVQLVRDYTDSVARAILEGLRPYLPLPAPKFFTDVPADSWFHDSVATCQQAGLFEVPPNGLFRPGEYVTRAELAAVLARLLRAR